MEKFSVPENLKTMLRKAREITQEKLVFPLV
jgi:hypothetical protein